MLMSAYMAENPWVIGLIGFRVLLSQWTVLCDHDDVFLYSVWGSNNRKSIIVIATDYKVQKHPSKQWYNYNVFVIILCSM